MIKPSSFIFFIPAALALLSAAFVAGAAGYFNAPPKTPPPALQNTHPPGRLTFEVYKGESAMAV